MAETTQQFSESDFYAPHKHTVVAISRLEARTNQIETQQILIFCKRGARRGSGGVRRCRFSGVSTDSAGDCRLPKRDQMLRFGIAAPPTARKAQDSPRNAEISDGTAQNRPKTSQITPRPPKIKLPCWSCWTANNRRCAWPRTWRCRHFGFGRCRHSSFTGASPPSIRHHSIQLAVKIKTNQVRLKNCLVLEPTLS